MIKIKHTCVLNYICKDQRGPRGESWESCADEPTIWAGTPSSSFRWSCVTIDANMKRVFFFFGGFWLERWAELSPSCPWWRNSVLNLQLSQRDKSRRSATVSRSMALLCDSLLLKPVQERAYSVEMRLNQAFRRMEGHYSLTIMEFSMPEMGCFEDFSNCWNFYNSLWSLHRMLKG